ncbi:hypothetical protein CVT26_010344 [Gymnopilus dilepis]|uniref:Cytochrome P450 n=1 Tax=Gymnopilus dilepis TaxID=231916 RepID=A0A409W4U7_9AGAR|nr:hypothetical protein CVT26_010344 [Gymnopilus dilepis]
MSLTATVIPVLTALVTCYAIYLWQRPSSYLPLPPGPKGYPIIGSVHEVPHGFAWLRYAQWKKDYGDISSITVFGRTTIVLNSLKACLELLDKRSYNYSDRPRMVMASELAGWDWNFAHMPYSSTWRLPRNMTSLYHSQRKTAIDMLERLAQSPEKFSAHLSRFVTSIVLRAAYGYEVETENDFYVNLAHKAIQPLLELVHAGTYLVEFLPILKHVPSWFPGASFKRKAAKLAVGARGLRDLPFESLKKSLAKGETARSFCHDNLEHLKSNGTLNAESEEVIKNCAGMVYLGGLSSILCLRIPQTKGLYTSSWLRHDALLHSFVLSMALNPAVQRKAQAEIDRVIGNSRLPDFSDKQSLPYLEAILLETMRWSPITPLALPHRAVREDVYEGYRIPAGAVVTPNVWAIFRDEEIYPDPWTFKPERFIEEDGKPAQPDPNITGGFGFGRRQAPHFLT